MDILGLIRRLSELVTYDKFDDDFFDRLNYSHTVAILTIFAIILTNRQFSENQIKCWVPAQFTGSYEQYVNQICFIRNTYTHDMYERLKTNSQIDHEYEVKYYQWTPFILLLMAILFYIPRQFWRALSLRSGIDIKDFIEAAQIYRSANIRYDEKMKLLEYLTNWLNNYCSHTFRLLTNKRRHIYDQICFLIDVYTGNYLLISYLFIKCLYLLNSIGQMFLLNTLLGRQFWFYGIEILHQYWTKQISILQTGDEYFPKVVLCDFTVREVNHPKESHIYTVQCVLSFNLFNQQIFTYLYFWLILLTIFNLYSIVIWFYRMLSYRNFHYFERRLCLNFLSDNHSDEQDYRYRFVYSYLQNDGTFLLHLLTSNVNDYVCTRILFELYRKYRLEFINQIQLESRFEDDDDRSTEHTLPDKIPIEHDTITSSSEEMSIHEIPERRRAVSFSLPTDQIIIKTPSPYATTYLTKSKPNEHELPYIDDSLTSSSTSANTRQIIQRSHNV